MQVIPYPPVVEALKKAILTGLDMNVVGTVRADNEEKDIEILSELEASSMILDAVITDKYDWNFIEEQLLAIKDTGAIPGLATHMPFKTTPKLLESSVLNLFNIYMIPINKLGYLMDCDLYGIKERAMLSKMIKSINKTIIVKKVLAAGILQPSEAFKYLKTLDFADIVALGIASEDEAHQTFTLLDSIE